MMSRHHAIMGILLFLGWPHVQAEELDFRGQLSTWATLTDEEPAIQVGGRYIAEFSLSTDLSTTWQLSGEAALDVHGYCLIDDVNDVEGAGSIDPYRLWVRLAASQFEARAGLQKISFGSATFLRPLMWFDTLDPRDPLQLTDGVYGLLGRYTFLNNANVWIGPFAVMQPNNGYPQCLVMRRQIDQSSEANGTVVDAVEGSDCTCIHTRIDPDQCPFRRHHVPFCALR